MIKRSYRALSISTKTFSEIMKLHGTAWHCTEIEVVSFTKQQQFFSLNDILSGDTHKWGLNLSSKADSVTKTNNQIIEETWLNSLYNGNSNFSVTRLEGVSMYPNMHNGMIRVYSNARKNLLREEKWFQRCVPLYTTEFSMTWLYGWAINLK